MKKIFLRAVVLLLIVSMTLSAFASCGETEKQDNDASEKEEVNDSEKPSGDEGASDEDASDDKGASDDTTPDDETTSNETTSDDNKIGTEVLAYKLLDDDTYEVSTGRAKEATEIVIPSKYNGKPVTRIGVYAFRDCTGLTSIVIPDSVTSIGDSAFYNCTALTSVTIGNGVESIGSEAFYGCTGLMSIDIPDSVTSIGFSAFENCTGLTSVTIGNGVESIGDKVFSGTAYYNNESNWENGVLYIGKYLIKANNNISGDYSVKEGRKIIATRAFYNCNGLTSIDIPDSVTSIGYYAFEKCTRLTSVTIGNGVESIGDGAFYNCTGLTSITVAEGNTKYHSAGNCIIETARKTLILGCKNSVIPTDGSVTSIGDSAFSSCTGLTSIDIPDSVKSIGYYAFTGCTGLTSIKFRGTEAEWNAIEKGNYGMGGVPSSCQIIFNYTGE